jgi:hypothetical protein
VLAGVVRRGEFEDAVVALVDGAVGDDGGRAALLVEWVASGKFWPDITTSGYVRSADGG